MLSLAYPRDLHHPRDLPDPPIFELRWASPTRLRSVDRLRASAWQAHLTDATHSTHLAHPTRLTHYGPCGTPGSETADRPEVEVAGAAGGALTAPPF